MSEVRTGTLPVPGASLFYKVLGTGPLLLLLPGGAGDAEAFNNVAAQLADHFTLLTYDRRGLSRSTVDDPSKPPGIETHSEDACRLLAALARAPALVFGNSIGAVIGLDLVARHAERVRAYIAHEPPLAELLSEPQRSQPARVQKEVEEIYSREGAAAAMAQFRVIAGLNFEDREPDLPWPPPPGPTTALQSANNDFFLRHDAGAVHRFHVNIDALQAAQLQTRIFAAHGATSPDWLRHTAQNLADRLGTLAVDFPGGHVAYLTHPKAFGAKLREVFDAVLRPRGSQDFEASYSGTPPWDIGHPQPAFQALADAGELRGRVLDAGCGTGEHALLAARMGFETTGIDSAPTAIEIAKRKARDRGLEARFLVWNALDLASLGRQFDTVLDSGLFHVFNDNDRAAYVASLSAATAPGGRYFMLCFSERQPGDFGPRRVTQAEIRASFQKGWRVDAIDAVQLEANLGPEGIFAWLAQITRDASAT
jgi:pimeloyl-ACP methyl ester carboxylesterase/SAM-dependent methyltransferase